ncbi:cell division protein FtsZ [Psychroserpens sp.]|uniref:cell division protein FtsZ n=1 Tax=Psychroserpens sp. TaxID=2020870 RepID=UPI001B2C63D0|nr:cell division protein FtsZ [Psychroserpens sp.]MBO6605864.1 cell division protein FtsZ [Psychroserpens sp.]MBO6631581.1 cell division protein FtsZ [Psychroserpens sp.]MBO6652765.1 cell division protein FtsZ [Psychroserpens sp.]MBO6681463.1 cell division protein FtsZ [Psychroserpens sp.]MBO6749238.1 cell division protein FtsZ [Psychroserpens sp.]
MSNNNELGSIAFDLPKNQSNVIKVIGVGGGGSNAINHMFLQGIKGVDFVICNTDAQALQNSGVPNKIQLGVNLTEGLGAGANPEVGEEAAVESLEDLRRMLDTNTKMVFITAGMGGGTGTGAAPIIAKLAKELDILTVGIVTMPFQFEGRTRNEQAQRGVENLRAHVDSLIVINNNKLREVYGNLGFKAGFSKADEVLSTASRGIAEVITHHYTQNIDLRDAKTVLKDSGTAIMGSASASGNNRAQEAIMKALDSPLLNDNKITGAKNVLLLIVSGSQEITIDEIGEINDHIQTEAGHSANIIMGVGEDESLDESISVTIIATGFDIDQQHEISNTEQKKVIHALEDDRNDDVRVTENDPAIITPDIVLEDQKETNPEIVVHTLIDDEADTEDIVNTTETELIATTDIIKNINVVYEEVLDHKVEEDDFVITPIKEEVVENIEVVEEEQITLTFDLPLSATTNDEDESTESKTIFTLDEEVKDMEVKEHVEIIPVTEANEEGEKRYALDDFMTYESAMNENETQVKQQIEIDEEVVFEKKVIESETEEEEVCEEIDPMNSPISELLKERADERRRKMKDFNYKFNNAKIDEIEKEPAYKRQGVNLEDAQHSSETNASRTSVTTDDNDDIQLRSNNSFLHDNVD